MSRQRWPNSTCSLGVLFRKVKFDVRFTVILRDDGVLFLHIPKTGGTSVEKWLRPLSSTKRVDRDLLLGWDPNTNLHLQHLTLQEVVDNGFVDREELSELTVVTLVRNPWSRILSGFHFQRRKESFSKASLSDYINREGLFEDVLRPTGGKGSRYSHWRPQTDYFKLDGTIRIDVLGRLENLPDFLTKMRSMVPRTRFIPFPHLNKSPSPKAKDPIGEFSPELQERVREVWKADFDYLAYPLDLLGNLDAFTS
jgi:hypothetical protein